MDGDKETRLVCFGAPLLLAEEPAEDSTQVQTSGCLALLLLLLGGAAPTE